MKIKHLLATAALLFAGFCIANGEDVRGRTRFQTTDGSVAITPSVVKLPNTLLTDNGDGTATVNLGSGTITGVTAGTGMSGGGTVGTVTLTNAGVVSIAAGTGLSGTGTTGAITLSTLISTYAVTAAGTAYSMTATTAAVTFGTTSPSFTIGAAGTYLIFARANLKYNGATYAASQTARLVLRRTNNTAAYITASETNPSMRVVTTVTDDVGAIDLSVQIYTTTTASDVIALWGFVSATPSAGSVDVNEANIVAVRIF